MLYSALLDDSFMSKQLANCENS